MPPVFRHPSQVGASNATKRQFKPPGSAKAGAPTAPPTTTTTASKPTAPTRPTASSSKAAFAAGTKPQSWTNKAGGFQSAAHVDDGDLEALLIDSDDEDDDDDLSAALANSRRPPPPVTVDGPPSTRQKTNTVMPRLPSLSPMSSANPPARDPSPPPQQQQQAVAQIGGPQDGIPLLPSPLVTRLLHESFDDKNVKVGKDANALVARYLDLFVREAVARATEVARERKEAREAGGLEEQDVWLEVQDLEEVAPGLVLDF